MTSKAFLTLALALAIFAGAGAHAQGTPPGATQDLPFVSEGANEPVLQPISPDAAPMDGAAEADHGARKGLPQFDVSTFARQLFWLALTFCFVYVVFSAKTLPAIGGMITARRSRIEADLAQAESLKSEIEQVRNEYEAAITKAQSDAAKIINDLQGDIKKSIEEQDAAFKSRAEQAIGQLEMSITANRARVMGELNGIAANLAVDITNRIAGIKTDEASARNAIDALEGQAKAA